MATKTTVELTDAEKDELVGGPHGETFPIPDESDFDAAGLGRLDAPELEAIAERLINRHFSIPLGHLRSRRIVYLFAKSGSTEAGKPRWGSVALASADLKHLSLEPIEDGEYGNPVDAVIRLAADHLREAEATRWQVGNELCFLLFRIGVYTTQSGDDRLRMVPPDSSFFTPQIRLFGPHSPELKKTILDIRQTRFEWADRLADDIARADAAKNHDPSPPLPVGVEDEIGPDPDGAPVADWADPYDDPLYTPEEESHLRDLAEMAPQIDANLSDRTEPPHMDGHTDLIREHFGTTFKGRGEKRVEVCKRCGVPVLEHRADFCAGGVKPEGRLAGVYGEKRSDAAQKIENKSFGADPDSHATNDDSSVLGHLSGSNGNAVIDPISGAGAWYPPKGMLDGLLADPDRVTALLSQIGWKIAYQVPIDAKTGIYINPETFEPYVIEKVESAYRAAKAGRPVSASS